MERWFGQTERAQGWRVWVQVHLGLEHVPISTSEIPSFGEKYPYTIDCFAVYTRDLGPCATEGKPRSSIRRVPD